MLLVKDNVVAEHLNVGTIRCITFIPSYVKIHLLFNAARIHNDR